METATPTVMCDTHDSSFHIHTRGPRGQLDSDLRTKWLFLKSFTHSLLTYSVSREFYIEEYMVS